MEERTTYQVGISEQELGEIEDRATRGGETGAVWLLSDVATNDVPRLLAEIRRLWAENEKLAGNLKAIEERLGELVAGL